jgi:hypothetical protein
MSVFPQACVFLNDPAPIRRLRLERILAQTDAIQNSKGNFHCTAMKDTSLKPDKSSEVKDETPSHDESDAEVDAAEV